MEENEFDFLIKIVLIGDTSVGKSNLLSRYVSNYFDEESKGTIGVDFAAKHLVINDKNIKVQIWDTAGQEKFRAIIKSYYANAHGFVIVYDVTKQNSFLHLKNWIDILEANSIKDPKILMIGNKIDLEDERVVSPFDGEKMAQEHKSFFMETSAKTNQDNCVERAFGVLIENIFSDLEEKEEKLLKEGMSSIYQNNLRKNSLHLKNSNDKKSCCF